LRVGPFIIARRYTYAPELNPVEQVWAYLRANFLSYRVWNSYGAIVDACCDAWNKLMNMPQRLASITHRTWAMAVSGYGRYKIQRKPYSSTVSHLADLCGHWAR